MTEDVESDPDPYEVTREELAELVTGMDPHDLSRWNPGVDCRRCQERFRTRMKLRAYGDVDDESGYINDGDRARIQLTYESIERLGFSCWRISSIDHVEHPQLPPERFAFEGVPLAIGEATVVTEWSDPEPRFIDDGLELWSKESEGRHFEDVEITFYSPPDEGQPFEDAVAFFGEGLTRGPIGRAFEVPPMEPVAWWPEETNRWRAQLVELHGGEGTNPV